MRTSGAFLDLGLLVGGVAAAVAWFIVTDTDPVPPRQAELIYGGCALGAAMLLLFALLLDFFGFGPDMQSGTDVPWQSHREQFKRGIEESERWWARRPGEARLRDSAFVPVVYRLSPLLFGLAFFGTANYAGLVKSWDEQFTRRLALVSSTGNALLLCLLRRMMSERRWRSSGAAKSCAVVTQTVPGRRAGIGKIVWYRNGRRVEYDAVTVDDDLPTGTRVYVVRREGLGLVAVSAASLEDGRPPAVGGQHSK